MSGLSGFGGAFVAHSVRAVNTSMTNSSNVFMQASNANSTTEAINEFRFLAARSIRMSAIILSTFNTISAFATAMGILYDCYQRAKRTRARRQDK